MWWVMVLSCGLVSPGSLMVNLFLHLLSVVLVQLLLPTWSKCAHTWTSPRVCCVIWHYWCFHQIVWVQQFARWSALCGWDLSVQHIPEMVRSTKIFDSQVKTSASCCSSNTWTFSALALSLLMVSQRSGNSVLLTDQVGDMDGTIIILICCRPQKWCLLWHHTSNNTCAN